MWSVDRSRFNLFLENLVSITVYTPIIVDIGDGKYYYNKDSLVNWKGDIINFSYVINHYLNSKSVYYAKQSLIILFNSLAKLDLEFLYNTSYNHSMCLDDFNDEDNLYKNNYYQRALSLGMEKLVYSNDDIYYVLMSFANHVDAFLDLNNSFDSLKFFILTSYLCSCYYETPDYDKSLLDNSNLEEYTFENWYNYIRNYVNEKLNIF